MSRNNEIKDDEIRVISSADTAGTSSKTTEEVQTGSHIRKKNHSLLIILVAAGIILLFVAIAFLFLRNPEHIEETERETEMESTIAPASSFSSLTNKKRGYVEMTDTIVDGYGLVVLNPTDAVPMLHVGEDILEDREVVMAMKAADIRADNEGIVGTFVDNGKLLSKGEAKAGFCAIINGTPIIGTAKSTPYLEEALATDGYFFRQYPLVAGGQIVENKPKGKSYRKALARMGDNTVVVISKERLSFHDFSEALTGLGVSEAIYLIGSTSYGFAIDQAGNRHEFGIRYSGDFPNSNYIIWK